MSKEVQVISGRMKQICNDTTKKQLVQESYSSGLSLNQFAKQRGISAASLCQWRKKFPEQEEYRSNDSGQTQEDLIRENESLRRENARLKAFLGAKIYELESSKYM